MIGRNNHCYVYILLFFLLYCLNYKVILEFLFFFTKIQFYFNEWTTWQWVCFKDKYLSCYNLIYIDLTLLNISLQWCHMTLAVSQIISLSTVCPQLIQTNNKGNIKGVHQWIPLTKGQQYGKCSHAIKPSSTSLLFRMFTFTTKTQNIWDVLVLHYNTLMVILPMACWGCRVVSHSMAVPSDALNPFSIHIFSLVINMEKTHHLGNYWTS